ncbi:DUF5777 family beta-barrel protein [candidate division KSB1 bacterium]|nr:DUF5777 family beta-barrel protein [candidate division KSB1 bacterium]
MLFRISHRYYPTVASGYETYFGINGPAVILVSVGYGLTEHLSLTLGHTNQLHAWELAAKWQILKAGHGWNLPLSASLAGGLSWITQEQPNQATLRSENFKYHAQLIVEYQIQPALAVLLTPGFATTSQYWQGTTQGTLTLGSGVHVNCGRNLALIGEWIPVLHGYRPAYAGFGFGIEAKTGGHVFQLLVTNSVGMLVDQYLPGGDLNYRNNDYRFGFNI